MAKDKKSFILYADLWETIKLLPDETSGKLFKLILGYVNDENPVTEELIVNVLFSPIKQQLKRDLVKWETNKSLKSLNGQIGNLKKHSLDVYNQYVSGAIDLDTALNIAKGRKVSLSEGRR